MRLDVGHTTAGLIYHECIIYIHANILVCINIYLEMHRYVCMYIYIYVFILWVVLKEGIKKNLRSQQKY